MRGLFIVTAASIGLLAAAPAAAQQRAGGHAGGQWHGGGHAGGQMRGHWQSRPGGSWHWNGSGRRWGGTMQGQWYGGVRAPGGWAAYRRPVRGWRMPSYWVSPSWRVWDWSDYGLYAPPTGYSWSRYYDDAVLIDGGGQVYDSRSGVDWDDYDQGYDEGYRDGYDAGQDAPPPPPPPAPDYGYQDYDRPPPPPVRFGPHAEVVQPLGEQLPYPAQVTTRCVGDCAGVYADGYYYPPRTETTVTIPARPATVTTTTTTTPGTSYVVERAVPVRSSKTTKLRKVRRVHRYSK